jgi:hypothetical protein
MKDSFVIDAFPLAYGAEILLLRLQTLDAVVDRHVIFESGVTHSGKPRELLWPTLVDLPAFAPFRDKVVWMYGDCPYNISLDEDDIELPWAREAWTFDTTFQVATSVATHLAKAFDVPPHGAIVLFGDYDEIPSPWAVHYGVRNIIDKCQNRVRLWVRYHEWRLDLRVKGTGPWDVHQPCLVRATSINETGSQFRHDPTQNGMYGIQHEPTEESVLGWHFTLQGGATAIVQKLRSYAHVDMAQYREEDIRKKIMNREDILNRYELELVPSSELPVCVQNDLEYWQALQPPWFYQYCDES